MRKNNKKIIMITMAATLSAALLVGCNTGSQLDDKNIVDLDAINSGSETAGDDTWAIGSKQTYKAHSEKGDKVISFAFLQQSEAKDQIASSIMYYENMNERNIEYRMQKKGATKDELKQFAQDQCKEFTDPEVNQLMDCMDRIQKRFDDIGYRYPLDKPFFFAKTTMLEECGNDICYARDNCIYVSDAFLEYFDFTNESDAEAFDYLVCKELFHILVVNNPEFKENMDRIFGFTTCQEPFFEDDAKEAIYRLPNVGDYDAYAEFIIDGNKRNAIVVPIVPEYTDGADLIENMEVGLVDPENVSEVITLDRVTNFYQIMGNNTGYVNTIEECAADNFAMAVCYGNEISYSTPDIINAILDYLKTGNQTKPVTGKEIEVTIILDGATED